MEESKLLDIKKQVYTKFGDKKLKELLEMFN